MRAERRLFASFALLLGLQLVTSFGAIALLGRMTPAIERILQENVYSVQAVEEMLSVLSRPGPATPDERRAFADALQRARNNVTEDAERPVLRTLSRAQDEALAGDSAARTTAAAALRELGRINREAMQRADLEAQRLGTAGAWAAVFLGVIAFLAGVLAMLAARRRILDPLREIERVVDAHHDGQLHRRCTLGPATSPALSKLGSTLNTLLDHRERVHVDGEQRHVAEDRALVLRLLDMHAEPTVIVDARGHVIAANGAAEDILAGPEGEGVRDELRGLAAGDRSGRHLANVDPAGDEAWICRLAAS